MMVDFPDPDGPTSAVVFPASNWAVKFFRTSTSGLVGYLKQTSLNVICPFNYWRYIVTPRLFGSTIGVYSITFKANFIATLACWKAMMAGPDIPICIAPKMTQNMMAMHLPPVYNSPFSVISFHLRNPPK